MKRAEEVAKTLEIMRIESVGFIEGFIRVMEISTKLKITFYDASPAYSKEKWVHFNHRG